MKSAQNNIPSILMIDENTKLSAEDIVLFSENIPVRNSLYNIYTVKGYYHTLGGKYGVCDLWACPSNEKPTNHNLIPFNGISFIYGIEARYKNYVDQKYGDSYVESKGEVTITLYNENFFTFYCNDLSYGIAKAQVLIEELKEHPINFHVRDYAQRIIGRKVMYKGIPAEVMYWYGETAQVMLKLDIYANDTKIKASIFDKAIEWYR